MALKKKLLRLKVKNPSIVPYSSLFWQGSVSGNATFLHHYPIFLSSDGWKASVRVQGGHTNSLGRLMALKKKLLRFKEENLVKVPVRELLLRVKLNTVFFIVIEV